MKRLIYVLSVVFLIAACNVMDKEPLDIISDAVVWDDPALVEAYVGNIYQELHFFGTNPPESGWYMAFLEKLSDQAGPARTQGAGYKGGNMKETSSGVDRLILWPYSTIRKMNEFYQNMESSTMPVEQKNLFIGSVKFVEAFTYFEMAKRYGAVPLITEPQNMDDPEETLYPSRTPEVEVYNYALSLLDEVYQQGLLPNTGVKAGYPSMGAVLALKSQIGLYAASIARWGTVKLDGLVGVPKNEETRFWQASFDASNEIIEEYPYTLYEKYPTDLPKRFHRMSIDKDNPERIFVREYDGVTVSHRYDLYMSPPGIVRMGQASVTVPYLDFVESFEKVDGSSGIIPREWETNKTLVSVEEIFGGYDPRMDGAILHEGSKYMGKELHFYNGLRLPNGTIMKNYSQSYQGVPSVGEARQSDPGAQKLVTGFTIKKYLDEDLLDVSEGGLGITDFIIFRLGEVYLERAEAAFYLGKTAQALADVNTIRARAGMPLHTSIDEGKIRQERNVELCFEDGARYWDLKRWRVAVEKITKVFSGLELIKDYNTGKFLVKFIKFTGTERQFYSEFREEHYYVPINPAYIAQNPNLAPQNPGYESSPE